MKTAAILLAAICAGTALAAAAKTERPNIVLIVSDDHGTDALGCYGNPVVRTPNLDALAADGTRFTSAFCTTTSCSPSRSVVLTGLQNHRNGMYGLQHDTHHFQSFAGIASLPRLLSAAGYRTARVGKFHLAPESVYAFDEVLSGGTANDPASLGRSPVEMADRARGFIGARDGRPFFLYFATDDPHRSNTVLPDGSPSFDSYPAPNRFGNRNEGYPGVDPVAYDPDEVVVPPYLPDTPATRAELAEYYQSVTRLDQGIGRLIRILKESGEYERTLIVYISDNGPAFVGAKTTLYEPGIRLPCIVRAPGRTNPGSVQPAIVSWADLTPTLLDAAGALNDPSVFDGRTFLAGIDGAELPGRDETYASHTIHEITMYYPMRVVRTARYKLIRNLAWRLPFPIALDLSRSPTWLENRMANSPTYGKRTVDALLNRPEYELYDLADDPDEIVNLAGDEAHRAVRDELVAKLKAFQVRTRDPWRNN